MPTLAEVGIDKKLPSRPQKLAGVPEAVCLGSPSTRETALAGARRPAGLVPRACGSRAVGGSLFAQLVSQKVERSRQHFVI